jgi:hypothetical protein
LETYSHLQYLEEQVEELDWFSKLPSQLVHKTRDSITLAVKQKKIFWTPPIDVEFDYEWGIDDKMHSKLLETFSSASYGVLNPHRITEALELSTNFGSVHFSFSCNEKTYSISMPHNGDWLCLDFFNLLDAVMYDTGTSLQFIDLNNPTKELQNQLAQFILCTPQAFFKAAERGLISPVRHITWLDGDILSYRLKSGDFILILVINLEEKEGLFGAVCAILDWHGPRVPRIAEFTKLKIHQNDND